MSVFADKECYSGVIEDLECTLKVYWPCRRSSRIRTARGVSERSSFGFRHPVGGILEGYDEGAGAGCVAGCVFCVPLMVVVVVDAGMGGWVVGRLRAGKAGMQVRLYMYLGNRVAVATGRDTCS